MLWLKFIIVRLNTGIFYLSYDLVALLEAAWTPIGRLLPTTLTKNYFLTEDKLYCDSSSHGDDEIHHLLIDSISHLLWCFCSSIPSFGIMYWWIYISLTSIISHRPFPGRNDTPDRSPAHDRPLTSISCHPKISHCNFQVKRNSQSQIQSPYWYLNHVDLFKLYGICWSWNYREINSSGSPQLNNLNNSSRSKSFTYIFPDHHRGFESYQEFLWRLLDLRFVLVWI